MTDAVTWGIFLWCRSGKSFC